MLGTNPFNPHQPVHGTRKLEVGYHVSPRWHGLGLATEAASACLAFARQHLAAGEVVAIVHPENRASQRVAQKIGMRRVDDDHGSGTPRRVFSVVLA